MESPVDLRLLDPLDSEPEPAREDPIPLPESCLSVCADPSLLLLHAVDHLESETFVRARFFRQIGNTMTMPYPPTDS
jgi:hypothetical protein